VYRNTVPVAGLAPAAYDDPGLFSECRSSHKVLRRRETRAAAIVAEAVEFVGALMRARKSVVARLVAASAVS